MLEKLKDVPPGLEALKAVGKISKEDYEKVFELDEARQKGRRIRLLCQIGPEFQNGEVDPNMVETCETVNGHANPAWCPTGPDQ